MQYIYSLLFFLLISVSSAVSPPDEALRVMTWNTRFLFDVQDDPDVVVDQDQMPEDYEQKISQTAAVILRHNPDVLGLQEVENRKVLQDLNDALHNRYTIEHFDSMDSFTGQDVALLYDSSHLSPVASSTSGLDLSTSYVEVDDRNTIRLAQRHLSKGLLTVPLQWKATGENLTFLIVHLKSQIGGAESDFKRLTEARLIRENMEKLDVYGNSLILMGDLNDVPNSMTLEEISGESRYNYGFDPDNIILYRDLFADASIPDNYTHMVSKWLKAGGKFRFMGSYKTRLDYIISSPWIAHRFVNLQIDPRIDLENKTPSDHRPLIADLLSQSLLEESDLPKPPTTGEASESTPIHIRE